jgi:hypothetical protein
MPAVGFGLGDKIKMPRYAPNKQGRRKAEDQAEAKNKQII